MAKELDEIMSGEGGDSAVQPGEGVEQAEGEQPSTGRDDKGRFAGKQQEAEPPEGEGEQEPQGEEPPGQEGGKVPQQALHAAREREREAREEARRVERELAELRGQVNAYMQQSRQAQAPQEPEQPPDFWEDPNKFVEFGVQQALTPVQRAMMEQREGFSRLFAEEKHGAETVNAAYQAMDEAFRRDPSVQHDYRRIMSSPHPYGELVKWHQSRQAINEIGSDPAAFREKVKAEILAEMNGQQPAQQQQQPAAKTPMPTNFASARNPGPRSGPGYSGPKPLSEITKGSQL